MTVRYVVMVTAVAMTIAIGCAKSGAPAPGTERGACYGNGTCNDGMLCLSDRCVRPPPADCERVVDAVVSLELGNYAPRDERAARVAELVARCRELKVTKDEGACLIAATTVVEATYCPKPLLAPGRGPTTMGLPAECAAYADLLERYSMCMAVPEATRASLRDNLVQLRRSWDGLGASAMTPGRTQACQQGQAAIEQGMRQLGCP